MGIDATPPDQTAIQFRELVGSRNFREVYGFLSSSGDHMMDKAAVVALCKKSWPAMLLMVVQKGEAGNFVTTKSKNALRELGIPLDRGVNPEELEPAVPGMKRPAIVKETGEKRIIPAKVAQGSCMPVKSPGKKRFKNPSAVRVLFYEEKYHDVFVHALAAAKFTGDEGMEKKVLSTRLLPEVYATMSAKLRVEEMRRFESFVRQNKPGLAKMIDANRERMKTVQKQ